MKKSILTLIVLSIIGTSAVSANPRHDRHHNDRPVVVVHHEANRHHRHARPVHVVEARPVAPRTVVVTPPRPVPAPRPVVVVERHPDNVATAAVVGGIIGGVIGAIVR
ncbi:MAG: hypothetical protein IJV60_02875 [Prevotella sp.]|nr:hypothetical protein [Prevotella sp.]MBQ8114742.1 hypothetical protein [Prevotella sp.]